MTENSISSSSFSSERTKCQMKSSGIPWIGEIPSDWMKNTIGRLSDSISSGGTPKAGDSRFYTDEGVSFVSISDMSNVDYVTQTNKHLTELGIKDKKLTVYPAGTILYSIYATLGKVSELAIPAAINQAMLAIVPSEELDKGYFKYSLKAMENYIVSVSNGNTQNNLSAEIVSHAVIPLPPIEVQKRISVLLDNRCNLIDSQISSVEDSVSKLEYLKQSIITEVVTKGLNTNVEVKESGVSWIGTIPYNWRIMPLKQLFRLSKGLPITKENLTEEGISVISYGQIHSKSNTGVSITDDLIRKTSPNYVETNPECKTDIGDLIVADTSEDLDGCGNAVYVDRDDIYAGYHSIILHSERSDNKYLAYLMRSDIWRSQIRSKVYGVKLYSITNSILSNCDMLLPPEEEREDISHYLDRVCSSINLLIHSYRQTIDHLITYKQSLIYEYVTGKKLVSQEV